MAPTTPTTATLEYPHHFCVGFPATGRVGVEGGLFLVLRTFHGAIHGALTAKGALSVFVFVVNELNLYSRI